MLVRYPARTFFILSGITLGLLLLNIGSFWNFQHQGGEEIGLFFNQTNFSEEKNLPSIFSSFLHLFASFSLALVGIDKLRIEKRKFFWWFLSFVFLFLSLDELLRIHEKITGQTSYFHENTGTYLWTIYYGIGSLLLGLVIIKPLFALPPATRNKFILAGAIFIFGAIGMENIAGNYIVLNNIAPVDIITHPDLFIFYTIEETMEMMGVIFFIYAVLDYKKSYQTPVVQSQN